MAPSLPSFAFRIVSVVSHQGLVLLLSPAL
jgi:hypothetical protein